MKKITDPICVKCGHLRVLDAKGRTYCRECMSTTNTRNAAKATASRKARAGDGWAVRSKQKVDTDLTCPQCGQGKTMNVAGQLICRECKRTNGVASSTRLAAARAAAKHESQTLSSQGPTAFEVFDAVCDLHGIGSSIPRMNPNAGRLRAGESLYPRREVAA